MKTGEAKRVGAIIEDMLRACGGNENFDRQRALLIWADVMGPAINRLTTRRYFDRDGALHVFISSAPLKNELQFLRPRIVASLNDALGADVVKNVIIH